MQGNAAGNLVLACPAPGCGLEFDAAPGEAVEVSTEGGRLTVRQLVAAARDLREVVRDLEPDEAARLVEEVRRGTPLSALIEVSRALGDWMLRHPQLAVALSEVLTTVLGGLILHWILGSDAPAVHIEQQNVQINIDHQPSEEELSELLRKAYKAGLREGRRGP